MILLLLVLARMLLKKIVTIFESAGCVLANRLASRYSVLLLEAGEDDASMDVKVPPAFPKLFKSSRRIKLL